MIVKRRTLYVVHDLIGLWVQAANNAEPAEPPDTDPYVRWCGLSITHKSYALLLGSPLEYSDIGFEKLINYFSHFSIIVNHFPSLRQLYLGYIYSSRLLLFVFVG